MSISIAQTNIQALQTKPYFSELVINQINEREKNEIDLVYINKINKHVTDNILEQLSAIDFNSHINFVLFGFYDISLIEQVMNRMSKLSTLTIFEKNIDVIVYTFGTKDVSSILSDPRVVLITGEKEQMGDYVTLRVTTREFGYNLPRMKFISASYMKEIYQNYMSEISRYLISQAHYIANSLGNDINDMLEGFDHTVENYPNLLKSLGVNAFKDQYKGIPAIIVSAGPSLDKNIKYLKQAYGKALILTVDTTLKKVLDMGIIPDTVSTIERPKNMYSIFYKEVNVPEETIFIGPSVVTKEIIDEFNKFIFTGRQGEPPVRAVADALGYESLEIGLSCAHIPFAFANYIGADPIVFIGQDLAFSKEGNTHFGEASSITKEGARKLGLVEVEGNDGSKLTTNKIYYQFLLWFQSQIAQIHDKTIINATEGGANIEGTTLMPFEQVIKKYCHNDVTHLSELYDQVECRRSSNQEEKKQKIRGLLELLDEECGIFNKTVNQYKDELMHLNGSLSDNVNYFYAMRKELDLVLNRNHVLNFLLQTITLKYNRSFNSYSSELKEDEWEKLKSEGLRYYNLLQQVCDALIVKFKQYLNEINSYK